MSAATEVDYDVIIVGGGLVGSSLALALQQVKIQSGRKPKVALVEAIEFDSELQASYDERTIALTYSSKLICDALDVWQGEVEREACSLKRIHISNRGHFGICNLDCNDVHTPALGYVCPTRVLGRALYAAIAEHADITVICPATVTSIHQQKDQVFVKLDTHEQGDELSVKLVVVADGGRSTLLGELGFVSDTKAYNASAILSIVTVDRAHHHVAYERFTPAGPLALLPLSDRRVAAVWTETNEQIAKLIKLSDEHYLEQLQSAFGFRAGLFSTPSARKVYPLKQSQISTPYQQRTLVLGNAAHTVHPVGGQGFNLSLRDVAAFVELAQHGCDDLGETSLLKHYAAQRATETNRVAKFTDGLLTIFSEQFAPVSLGRNSVLSLIEHLPFSKRLLLKRTMGLAGHQANLARATKALHKGAN